jgi:hypothetical protein
MPQSTSTILLRGGLNLVSPQVAVQPGQAIAGLNYEPDAGGYRRMVGFERYDGRPSPSDGADSADRTARRAAIGAVPGQAAVRGVAVYDGAVWAFRDTLSDVGGMYRSSDTGWTAQSFGSVVFFNAGTAEFLEGEVLVGGTSAATATIERVVLQSGTYGTNDAAGYLVVSDVVGTFEAETITSDSGSATLSAYEDVTLPAGGRYDFAKHNFYGAAKRQRLYFANGVGTAMEWDGAVLAPIRSGNQFGELDDIVYLLADNDDFLITDSGDFLILQGENDRPTHIGHFANHLFLGFGAGAVIHSEIGEPLGYTALGGAGEFSLGMAVTGFLTAAAGSFIIFGASRVEYLTGTDEDTFVMSPITDKSGAFEWTTQMAGDQPAYQDEGGIRKLGTTSAFGDWRMGALTEQIEPLFRAKRAQGVAATASLVMRAKDQLYLFFDDATGVIVYLGRKAPEPMPFKLPVTVTCACSGELDPAEGERHFVGCSDGYVYELNRGTSFDGASVPAFIRFAFNALGAPAQQKRFHSAELQIDAPDEAEIGVAFDVDYAITGNVGGAQQNADVAQGSPSLIPLDQDYGSIDWSKPVQGVLRTYLDGIGRNCAITVITEHTDEQPHTLGAMTLNYSPRRVLT